MTDEEYDKQEAARLAGTIAWLEKADPDDWHRFALDFQWAEPFDTLYWIVRQERCDAATAQMLFWLCQPGYFIGEDDGSSDEPDPHTDWNKEIVVHIARRFSSGGYARSELGYTSDTSTRTDYVDLLRMEHELDNPNFRTTPGLIENRSGREVWPDRDFYARFPKAFWHGSPPSEPEEGVEYVPLEPPGYRETMRVLDLVEQEARRRLPPGLKTGPDPELDLTEVRAEARWLALYTISAGSTLALIVKLHSAKPLLLGTIALLWVCWSIWSSVREIQTHLRYSRRKLNMPWASALLGLVLLIAMGLTSISLGAIGNFRIAHGLVPTILTGLALVLPLLWLAAKPLAGLLVNPRGVAKL
ncbi:MAG: DUF4274 domain-containing protein [Novosphingobium sp.]|nr:DUF4274 domain-containing protein [Novosphingobium sp.]